MALAKVKDGNFEPCPEYVGEAVCVDVTPLKKVNTAWGEKEIFRFVFEIDRPREDGSRWCVWSSGFTLTLGEKSGLRKFLRSWRGHDLTAEEMKNGFDTETMVGKPAFLVIVHNHKDDQTFANIEACTPHKAGAPLTPSGKYVRVIHREKNGGNGNGNGGGGNGGRDSSYRRTEGSPAASGAPQGSDEERFLTTKIHVGAYTGQEIRDVSEEGLGRLVANWLPAALKAPKLTADDRRLVAALEWWQARQTGTAVGSAVELDDVPF